MKTSVQLTFIYLVTDTCNVLLIYPLELHDKQVDKSTGNTIIAQDAEHSENESVKSMRPPTRQLSSNQCKT